MKFILSNFLKYQKNCLDNIIPDPLELLQRRLEHVRLHHGGWQHCGRAHGRVCCEYLLHKLLLLLFYHNNLLTRANRRAQESRKFIFLVTEWRGKLFQPIAKCFIQRKLFQPIRMRVSHRREHVEKFVQTMENCFIPQPSRIQTNRKVFFLTRKLFQPIGKCFSCRGNCSNQKETVYNFILFQVRKKINTFPSLGQRFLLLL